MIQSEKIRNRRKEVTEKGKDLYVIQSEKIRNKRKEEYITKRKRFKYDTK